MSLKHLWIKLVCVTAFAASHFVSGIQLSSIVEGLDKPVYVTAAPGDESGKLYVVGQKGKIFIVQDGAIAAQPFKEVKVVYKDGDETGLLNLAFHPNFKENQRYFIYYTTDQPDLRNILAEYKVGSDDEKVLRFFQKPSGPQGPFTNHNGSQLAFDQNGHLFVSVGDGGNGGDPKGNGQNVHTLLGKILRLDVDSPSLIPPSNPFASDPNSQKEIYALGFRNPWRFSFERLTGALFVGDVGQEKWEEIDIMKKPDLVKKPAQNFGWNTMEGKHCFNPANNCNQAGLTLPVWEYGHNGASASVTGGYVYRGSKIPNLYGVYIYADYVSGNIWGLHYDQNTGSVVSNDLLLESKLNISSFGEDKDGEILVVSGAGTLYRITP